MKAVVAAFNQEKALVGAFSVITNLRMELFQALDIILFRFSPHQDPSPTPGSPRLWAPSRRWPVPRRANSRPRQMSSRSPPQSRSSAAFKHGIRKINLLYVLTLNLIHNNSVILSVLYQVNICNIRETLWLDHPLEVHWILVVGLLWQWTNDLLCTSFDAAHKARFKILQYFLPKC